MSFQINPGFISSIADDPAATAAGYLTPSRHNLPATVSGATAGGIPYCPTATSIVTSANFIYTETSGPRLQVGSGTTTSIGLQSGYTGTSGYAGVWLTGRTPSLSNYSLLIGNGASTFLNADTYVGVSSANTLKARFGFSGNGLELFGNLIPSQTLSTTMTDGFINMAAAAGPPTGVPNNTTGAPFYYDTTNNQIYIYNGAWKKTVALT